MTVNTDILQSNLKKWEMLPAGNRRESVEKLLSMDSEALLKFYKQCITFWKKERGWEYERYSNLFSGRSVLEIGSGMGYDGVVLSNSAKKWTFCDIIPSNIEFVQRVACLLDVPNISLQLVRDIFAHEYGETFDGFYAHGVLHHVPFEIAKKEVENIDRFLEKGTCVVLLMYPYERWAMCGKPSFERFGCMTDGEGTPWAEYYDERKIQQLFGPNYQLENTQKWGHQNAEFVNFELTKK